MNNFGTSAIAEFFDKPEQFANGLRGRLDERYKVILATSPNRVANVLVSGKPLASYIDGTVQLTQKALSRILFILGLPIERAIPLPTLSEPQLERWASEAKSVNVVVGPPCGTIPVSGKPVDANAKIPVEVVRLYIMFKCLNEMGN